MVQPITNFSPEKQDMAREDIVAAIHKRGLSLRALSVLNGFKPTTLNNALNGPYKEAEEIIAKALDMKVEDIWPSRVERRRLKESLKQQLASI
ncbi:helix-turn-helix domain-containing protein [Vibrio cholerae]|uniref:helix-turn-helix domain-containing protein n=1 Tax=Vibrio cholerae TaxID=666 RepID=UPI001033A0EC|nr:helix-turn-helix domain-containing protein [Vibrio cholerae]EKO3992059.1 transcriptional regulator [Vibrio fluvialis]EGR1074278.1 transcriptional regulator [Vibrio cholerae]EGR2414032.1 transcriptional regulator [Vibrio cholerae]EGR2496720.1 transcriptional regulator [Vibrio cholerae]MBY7810674.1 helix-turn-helix domain-containing protein [Vibrio fluvialis]